jgi:hypothetical protein
MARTICNRVVGGLLLCGLSMAACQSTPGSTPATPPQVTMISSILGLGITVYDPERRTLSLYSVGPEQQVTRCVSWRVEEPEHWPMPQPCAATAPPPPVRKTVP